tara:strand:+ start:1541 stop:1822 length:282 start_codon:yes stop_codon:yes gene_type:complete
MNRFDNLRILFNRIFNREKSYKRNMKRVFQWERYLEWKDLTTEEKLSAKRFLLVPVFAYVIIGILNQNLSLIILFLIGYALYKKYEKGGIIKK